MQSFLEESRQLMRLPPRQSTAEADLMVPFQLVSLLATHGHSSATCLFSFVCHLQRHAL